MAEQSSTKLLIFDTILNGHHSDYILHLVEYWCSEQIPGELIVVTPRGFSALRSDSGTDYSRITFLEMSDFEILQARSANRLGRSFAEWNLFVKYARQLRPNHALIMYFDLYQLGAWIGKKAPCPYSGIYFRPCFHYVQPVSWLDRITMIRKKWLLARVLATRPLSTLFCLDKSSVESIQKMARQVRVLPLSDPVREYGISRGKVAALRDKLGVKDGRKVFLLFGYLDERKGIEPMLEAIRLLSPVESGCLSLIVAGPIAEAYRNAVEAHIASLDTQAQIICHFHELRGEAVQVLFELSDYVLTLYRRHIGMSSIVIRAALSRKPLISSDFGYMGSLVKTEELGAVVNSESPISICEAVRQALQGKVTFSQSAIKKLSEQNTSQLFASQIMGEVLVAPLTPVQ